VNGFYIRTTPIDVLEVDGEALMLLHPDQVVRLSPIATTIFNMSSSTVSLDHLASVVEEQFGPPPDGATVDILPEILDDLVASGVLEHVTVAPAS